MIAVRLMGGLGNQMFQYAAARRLAQQHNTKVLTDLVFYENTIDTDTPRSYELSCFSLPDSSLLPHYKRPIEQDNFYSGKNGIIRKLGHTLTGRKWHIYREPHHQFDKTVIGLSDRTYLIGFWQTELYFNDIRHLLLEDFTFKKPLIGDSLKVFKSITSSCSVSLHVRRGDYITNKNAHAFHGTKDISYYQKAIKEIEKKVSRDFKIFVFSDDQKWCKKNLAFNHRMIFVEGNKDGFEDMRLMKSCKHNIIANSSFSWWGAWLNNNPNKIVIAPKQWFSDSTIDTSDVVPKSWIKI